MLVEFVANAYDADSPSVSIRLDKEAIDAARVILRNEYEADVARARNTGAAVTPLAERVLPENISIVIEDAGCGMSREDLQTKFLFAGRRRRIEEPERHGRSIGGRAFMGRKGLGKLAGFGVAKSIEVISRKEGELHATRIHLLYDQLIRARTVTDIVIPDFKLDGGGGFAAKGTRIVLSQLLYDPLKSRAQTIEAELAEHFEMIDAADFSIELNGTPVQPLARTHVFGWPSPDRDVQDLVEHTLPREGGGDIRFSYRLRFTGRNEALPASRRGVRVYANKRLAAAPSLLAADTNMHGFRMTDYLDGVVQADFIDSEPSDYIATDRQSLRWESPLLSPLHEFLSAEIKEACKQFQKKRDDEAPDEVAQDAFTIAELARFDFAARDKRLALRLAGILEAQFKRGVDDPAYRARLPALFQGVGHGNILTAISTLAEQDHPELQRVTREIIRLTKDELEQFVSTVRGRLKGIAALQKIVRAANFREADNEREIQRLFEASPWLVHPMYSQFLTADRGMGAVFNRLAQYLQIGQYAPTGAETNDKRPDLVFLLANQGVDRIVIVELKSANKPLEGEHLAQLELYMEDARNWLEENQRAGLRIEGHLIGTRPLPTSRTEGARKLRGRIRDAGANTAWTVRDYIDVVGETELVHRHLIEAYDERTTATPP